MGEKMFISVEEVASEMGISKSYAYKIVRKLNKELEAMNFLTVSGKVNAKYFTSELVTAQQPTTKGSDVIGCIQRKKLKHLARCVSCSRLARRH